jgi:hypothetical protein
VAGAHQVAANVLDRTDQVPELLIGDRRNKSEMQLTGGEQSHESFSVTLVGLDTVTRSSGDLARRHDLNVDPELPCGTS